MEAVTKSQNLTEAAMLSMMDRKTARGYLDSGVLTSESITSHTWRTRPNPFVDVWAEVEALISDNPGLQAGRASQGHVLLLVYGYSRKVVAWEVFAKEDGTLARDLFAQALEAEGIPAGQITIHADNGKPIRSKSLRGLFELMSVTASYGRPHTSNDNTFAESLFATIKGRVSFP